MLKKFSLLILIWAAFSAAPALAQTADSSVVLTFSEKMPEYPGGIDKMYAFISENVKYPKYCQKNGIEGRVVLTFVINDLGHINNITTLSSPHPLMTEEAIRVLKLMPNWIPGMQDGKNVNVKYTLPLMFKLK